jgi:hypothetical protein
MTQREVRPSKDWLVAEGKEEPKKMTAKKARTSPDTKFSGRFRIIAEV